MNHLLLFEQFLAEFSYHEDAIMPIKISAVFSPDVDYSEADFEKEYPADKGRVLYIDDLLHNGDGRALLAREDVDGTKSTRLADFVKKMEIRLNSKKAAIEHPTQYVKLWKALIGPGALSFDQLVSSPGVADRLDLDSPAWQDEALAKFGTDAATAARTFKIAVMKDQDWESEPRAEMGELN